MTLTRYTLKQWLTIAAATATAVAMLSLSGCTYVKVQDPATGLNLTVCRFGYDTKIGEFQGTRDKDGKTTMAVKNLDSEARALDVAKAAIDALGVAK